MTSPAPRRAPGADNGPATEAPRHCPKCSGFIRREPAQRLCVNCGWMEPAAGDGALQAKIDIQLRRQWPERA